MSLKYPCICRANLSGFLDSEGISIRLDLPVALRLIVLIYGLIDALVDRCKYFCSIQ